LLRLNRTRSLRFLVFFCFLFFLILKAKVEDETALRDEIESKDMKGTLILDCYADWCGPCKKLTPMLIEEVGKTANVRLAKLNVDSHDRLPEKLKVSAIPAVFAFYKGELIAQFVGCPSAADLATWVSNVADPEEALKESKSSSDQQ
jgi:thioredoxin 1